MLKLPYYAVYKPRLLLQNQSDFFVLRLLLECGFYLAEKKIDAAIETIPQYFRYFRIREGLKFRQNRTKHYKQNGITT